MAKRLYQTTAGDLTLWADPNLFVKTELEDELAVIEEIQALSPEARAIFASREGYRGLSNFVEPEVNDIAFQDFDAYLDLLRTRLKDIIDYFDYDTRVVNLTVADGAWFSPIAVEDFCGERTGDEAVNAIDGNTATFWQDNTNHPHQITFQLRDYSKRISKLRFYRGTNVRSELTDLTVQIANSIPGLDDPNNEALANFTPTWVDDAWNEVDLTKEQVGKYIRLTGFGSNNSLNQARIREVEAWVETQLYN